MKSVAVSVHCCASVAPGHVASDIYLAPEILTVTLSYLARHGRQLYQYPRADSCRPLFTVLLITMTFSSPPALPDLPISIANIGEINTYLNSLTPERILQWGIQNLPNLYQTTAFGLTGLVAIDMLSNITSNPPPLIFIDTLYHFPETYELVEEVKKKYNVPIHVYKPEGCDTVDDFEQKYGQKLWETDENSYDYAVKVRILDDNKLLSPP